tara:strand:- start:865 stop:1830 length:966 start_codon:yes stop_codon:yes gene_type:complete
MSRILVTGATGFVGQEVCRQLRYLGYMITGTTRNIGLQAGPENVPLHYMPEFSDEMDWSQAVGGVDVVIHLAARVHQMADHALNPLSEYRRVNVEGTKSLAIAAAAAGVKRFIFLSSIKANGEKTDGTAYSEEDVPAPVDAYGLSKWEAEQALAAIVDKNDMELVILRSPLVYGPNVGGNFAALAEAVIKKWPFPLGAVFNRRSLIYVGNLASAITTCLDHPKARGETFFVSDGKGLSTQDLVRCMAEAAGVTARIIHCPLWVLRFAGILIGRRQAIERLTQSLEVESAKIRRVLSWSPPYTMPEGIRETMSSLSARTPLI